MWSDPARDARLPFTILQPSHRAVAGRPPEAILLTGATGFVGAFLVHELLRSASAPLYCLVRAKSPDEAMKRILSNLESYGLPPPASPSKIIAIPGDLEQPSLGMPERGYAELAERIDCVIHGAAQINHVIPYLLLKNANVGATQELIRFSFERRLKVFHFLSSTAACVGQNQDRVLLFPEERVHTSPGTLVSSYGVSKWVGERSLENAAKHGLPVTIIRGGDMAGDSLSGQGKLTDFFHLFLRLFVELGLRPIQLSGEINVLPVDFVARIIAYIADQWKPGITVFNLVHPRPFPLQELFDYVEEQGYRLQETDLDRWVNECEAFIKKRYSKKQAMILKYLFRKEKTGYLFEWYFRSYPFHTHRLSAILDQAPFPCPALDRKLWTTYFSALIKRGFLQPPDAERSWPID